MVLVLKAIIKSQSPTLIQEVPALSDVYRMKDTLCFELLKGKTRYDVAWIEIDAHAQRPRRGNRRMCLLNHKSKIRATSCKYLGLGQITVGRTQKVSPLYDVAPNTTHKKTGQGTACERRCETPGHLPRVHFTSMYCCVNARPNNVFSR